MGKSTAAAPSPDPAIGRAALKSAELGDRMLEFATKQYADGLERQKVTDTLTGKVMDQQLATQDQANKWAVEDRTRTKSVFQPLQDEFIKTAQEFDTPEKQAEAAALAQADVTKQGAMAQQVQQRNMASMGVNPNSGRFAGAQRAMTTDMALGAAAAGNNARQVVRDKAIALKGDAINMGNGLASSAAAAYGVGTNAGNSAVGNNGAANAGFNQNGAIMSQGLSGAMNGYGQQAGILNNLHGNQLSAWNGQNQANAAAGAGMGSLVGSLAGAGATIFL